MKHLEKLILASTVLMKDTEPFLEQLGMDIFGRSRELAKAGNQCISCGKPATEFRDDLSRKEYEISRLCSKCQDENFWK